MKKIVVLFMSIVIYSLIGCEADADASDFLTNEDLESLIDDEIIIPEEELGILEPPVPIVEIDGVTFVAAKQTATLSGISLILKFVSVDGNELVLTIDNPANDTYTAQSTSLNLFLAEYTIGDGDEFYTTSSIVTLDALGALGLSINNSVEGETTYSGTFNFTAFNNLSESVLAVSGSFTDVISIN